MSDVTRFNINGQIVNIPSLDTNSGGILIYNDNSSASLNIGDPEGNVLVQFKDGHIKTQNFDSSDIKINNSSSSNINAVVANFKADVYMIPCYGQSLSTNTSAGTSTFSSIESLSFNTSLENANIQDMCAGTAEAFRIMADFYNLTLPDDFKIISSVDGAGGTSVIGLSKGTTCYTHLINSIMTAKANCDAQGLTMNVPCFTWTQGEEDMRCGGNDANYGTENWKPFEYKDKLKTLIEQIMKMSRASPVKPMIYYAFHIKLPAILHISDIRE